MPMMTHEQIHALLVGVATLQRVDADAFAQTAYTERSRFNHGHYVAVLHDIAGKGDPANVTQLLACMILARMTPHSPARVAQNDAWELEQVRRLFP
jgi:hypothetical protein